MGQSRPGGEPTEEATPRRLAEARKRGEVARSGDLISFSSFAAGAAALVIAGPLMMLWLAGYLRVALDAAVRQQVGPAAALAAGFQLIVRASAPPLAAVTLAVLIVSYLQSGGVFSLEPLRPQLQRLWPVENLKQVFGVKMLFELFKSLIKVAGVGGAAGSVLWERMPQLLRTTLRPPESVAALIGESVTAMATRVGLVVAVLAAADLLYQRWSYRRRMRMSKEEVKREQKEGEGDPQHKAERQRLHRDLVEQRMFDRVKEADCLVINPTQVAVAIRYDAEVMQAPTVLARGRGLAAARIRQIAREHGIPIIRNVPLARALVELELDDEVPGELYQAVAEVLRFVYRLGEGQAASQAAGQPAEPGNGRLRA